MFITVLTANHNAEIRVNARYNALRHMHAFSFYPDSPAKSVVNTWGLRIIIFLRHKDCATY